MSTATTSTKIDLQIEELWAWEAIAVEHYLILTLMGLADW